VGRGLFWPVLFKRKGHRLLADLRRQFGSPPPSANIRREPARPTAEAARGDSRDRADAGVIVPDGMLVELLEAARAGSIDTYEKLARYMDEQMSLACSARR